MRGGAHRPVDLRRHGAAQRTSIFMEASSADITDTDTNIAGLAGSASSGQDQAQAQAQASGPSLQGGGCRFASRAIELAPSVRDVIVAPVCPCEPRHRSGAT
jgi:hypothetical protein